jgi:hypothetical protein
VAADFDFLEDLTNIVPDPIGPTCLSPCRYSPLLALPIQRPFWSRPHISCHMRLDLRPLLMQYYIRD